MIFEDWYDPSLYISCSCSFSTNEKYALLAWDIDIWRKVVYQNNPFLLFEFRSEYHLSMNLELRRLVLMVVGFSRISWKTLHEQLLTCSMGCLRL